MKFEIDDKTGMIGELDMSNSEIVGPSLNVNSNQLEQILQAVKKTQEKSLNKQIQEVQDSKNKHDVIINVTGEQGARVYDSQIIERNQKIVDILKFIGDRDLIMGGDYSYKTLKTRIREATGKDIKDL